ncbi:MAG: ferritin-like domain-containing protein [Caldilineaceae bacterium]|nr:ferritin-like domain-containing protein [Caldilineaceae bacterium]
MQVNTLKDLYVDQLRDLYSAETQLIDALPKMAGAASSSDLKKAFQSHLDQTKSQKQRLEQIFSEMGTSPQGETCEAMKGLIKEGEEAIQLNGDPIVRDAALIAAAQRVEHYEMAGYGTVRTFADELGFSDAKTLLQITLNEEGDANKKLTSIAEGGFLSEGVNQKAVA